MRFLSQCQVGRINSVFTRSIDLQAKNGFEGRTRYLSFHFDATEVPRNPDSQSLPIALVKFAKFTLVLTQHLLLERKHTTGIMTLKFSSAWMKAALQWGVVFSQVF